MSVEGKDRFSLEVVELAGQASDVNEDGRDAAPQSLREEKQLVRKIDMRVMPILCMLYLFAYLARINLGNARLQGLPGDILQGDPTGVQFDWANSAFYFSYITGAVPSVLLYKLCSPRVWFGCAAIGYGACAVLSATSFNLPSLFVARVALGAFESALSPAIPIYMSLFYTKEEIGFRIAAYNSFGAIAGAFGGLVAFGIQKVHTTIANWKLLFIVEGAPSILFGVLAILALPNRPEETGFFCEDERKIAVERMNRGGRADVGRMLQRKHIVAAFLDWRVYAAGVIYFAANAAFASIAGFLPTIITTLGYSNALAQLLTAPPYLVAAILACSCANLSDRFKTRGVFVITTSLLSGTGYVLLLAVPSNTHVRYFATFCITSGTYGMIITALSWFVHNFGSETKKATAVAFFQAIGQCGSILGSHIYPLTEGPHYRKGLTINCALDFAAAIIAILLTVSYRVDNTQRNLRYGRPVPNDTVDTSELADKAPQFRYTP